MKVNSYPAAPPARPTTTAPSPSEAPGGAFEDLLTRDRRAAESDPSVLSQVQEHRALGFSEASLLGKASFAEPPAQDQTVTPIAEPSSPDGTPVPAAWLGPNTPSPAQAIASPISISATAVAGGRIGAVSLTLSAPPTPSTPTSTHAQIVRTISGVLHEAQAAASKPDEQGRSSPFDLARPPTPAAKTQVAVAVTETGGALQVIAASPGLNPEAAARVRRIVADLVERFGLRLSDLHLNGVRVEPPFVGLTGAPHGG